MMYNLNIDFLNITKKTISGRRILPNIVITNRIAPYPTTKVGGKTTYIGGKILRVRCIKQDTQTGIYVTLYAADYGLFDGERLLANASAIFSYWLTSYKNIAILTTIQPSTSTTTANVTKFYYIDFWRLEVTSITIPKSLTIPGVPINITTFVGYTSKSAYIFQISNDNIYAYGALQKYQGSTILDIRYDPTSKHGLLLMKARSGSVYAQMIDHTGLLSNKIELPLENSYIIADSANALLSIPYANGPLKVYLFRNNRSSLIKVYPSITQYHLPTTQIASIVNPDGIFSLYVLNASHYLNIKYNSTGQIINEKKISVSSYMHMPIKLGECRVFTYSCKTINSGFSPLDNNQISEIIHTFHAAFALSLIPARWTHIFNSSNAMNAVSSGSKLSKDIMILVCAAEHITILYGIVSILGLPVDMNALKCDVENIQNPHFIYMTELATFGSDSTIADKQEYLSSSYPQAHWIIPRIVEDCSSFFNCNSTLLLEFYKAVGSDLTEIYNEYIDYSVCKTFDLFSEKEEYNEIDTVINLEATADTLRTAVEYNRCKYASLFGIFPEPEVPEGLLV